MWTAPSRRSKRRCGWRPSSRPPREELADLYRTVDRPADEMRHLQALAQLDPGGGRRVAIALAEARHDQFAGALAHARATPRHATPTIRRLSSRSDASSSRARSARSIRDALTRGARALENALGGNARRSEGLALYGRALYLSGDATAAERILRDAVATSPVDLEAYRVPGRRGRASRPSPRRRATRSSTSTCSQGDTAAAEVRAARARRIGALSLRANDARTALPYLTQAVSGGHRDAATARPARARALADRRHRRARRTPWRRRWRSTRGDPDLQRLARAIR